MTQALAPVTLVVLAALLTPPAAADQQATKTDTAQSAPGACAAGANAAYCKTTCAPRNLVFLPCMAVGATNMARCREREVAACLRACASRRCLRAAQMQRPAGSVWARIVRHLPAPATMVHGCTGASSSRGQRGASTAISSLMAAPMANAALKSNWLITA